MIDLCGIEIKYNNFIAMNKTDLQIHEGEFFTLLGPSGCGKTSLLRTMTGFIAPAQGRISIKGKDVTDVSVEKRGIGMVFQSYAIFPTMNVFENIAFGLRVRKMSNSVVKDEVLKIAKMVDLSEDQLYKKASELSGGQQQRVAIARALILQPNILCLDEPLSNLDAKLRQQLRVELKNLQKKFGITTIYVTHDQEEALTLSDRIAVFDNGVLEQVGTPYEIFNSPKTEFVAKFIGDINMYQTSKLEEFGLKVSPLEKGISFIRLNAVKSIRTHSMLSTKVKVQDVEFHGFYVIYTYETEAASKIKNVEIDPHKIFEIGDEVILYFKKDDFIHL